MFNLTIINQINAIKIICACFTYQNNNDLSKLVMVLLRARNYTGC